MSGETDIKEPKQEVRTNLVTAVRSNTDNWPVFKKLIIFMAAEAVIPIIVFLMTKRTLENSFDFEKQRATVLAAGLSMFAVNVVICGYIYLAFTEEDGSTSNTKDSDKAKLKISSGENKKNK